MHPLRENFILGELKSLRTEMLELKAELIEKIANKELKVAEKSLNYALNAMNYFFVFLAGAVSLFAFFGVQTVREVKQKVNIIAEKRLEKIMKEYQERVTILENDIRVKGNAILKNQEAIHKTQKLQSIWVKINQEQNPYRKLQLYNNLLTIQPDFDVEVLKGSLLLELEEEKDASIQFHKHLVEKYPNHAESYYQRAKAYFKLNNIEDAIKDLEQSVELSRNFKEKIKTDSFWDKIKSEIKLNSKLS